MSGHISPARFDVIATTRRKYSEEQRAAILAELAGGETVSGLARKHGLHTSLLFRWRREAANEAWMKERGDKKPAMLPVAIADRAPPVSGLSGGTIEIDLCTGRRLRVSAGLDAAVLKRIILALETP